MRCMLIFTHLIPMKSSPLTGGESHTLMKIFTITGNYSTHNKDDEATLFNNGKLAFYTKPDTSLLKNGKPFFVPDELGRVSCQAELAVRVNRLGKSIPVRFAHRYYDAITVGVNFMAVDVLQRLQKDGLPWEEAVAFDGSAAIGEWVDKEKLTQLQDLRFDLAINGQRTQEGCSSNMIHSVNEIVAYVSRYMTLRTGDIIFTGTPSPAIPVTINDHIEGRLQGMEVLWFNVK